MLGKVATKVNKSRATGLVPDVFRATGRLFINLYLIETEFCLKIRNYSCPFTHFPPVVAELKLRNLKRILPNKFADCFVALAKGRLVSQNV